jgi:FkbM family methyltransferase
MANYSIFDEEDYPEHRPLPKLFSVKSAKGIDFLCREGTADKGIVTSFMKAYDSFTSALGAEEVWLDVGAHIGTFAVTVAPHVKKVIAFEACPETFEVLKKNTARFSNVECVHAAVIGGTQKSVHFAQSAGRTMGHLAKTSSRANIEIPAVCFSRLLNQPACVKMDIEGGEKNILDNTPNWSNIQRFDLEFHSRALEDDEHNHQYAKKTLKKFYENFQKVTTDFDETKKRWEFHIYGEK